MTELRILNVRFDHSEAHRVLKAVVDGVAEKGLMPEIPRNYADSQLRKLSVWAENADVAYVETAEGIAVSLVQIDSNDPHVTGKVLQVFLTLSTSAAALSRLQRGLLRVGIRHGCKWIYTTRRTGHFKYESTYRPLKGAINGWCSN